MDNLHFLPNNILTGLFKEFIYIYIYIRMTINTMQNSEKVQLEFYLRVQFASCVLNYLFLEKVLFPNFRIKCETTS